MRKIVPSTSSFFPKIVSSSFCWKNSYSARKLGSYSSWIVFWAREQWTLTKVINVICILPFVYELGAYSVSTTDHYDHQTYQFLVNIGTFYDRSKWTYLIQCGFGSAQNIYCYIFCSVLEMADSGQFSWTDMNQEYDSVFAQNYFYHLTNRIIIHSVYFTLSVIFAGKLFTATASLALVLNVTTFKQKKGALLLGS